MPGVDVRELRKAVGVYLSAGKDTALQVIVAAGSAHPRGSRAVLYEAFSTVLSGASGYRPDRLPGIARALNLEQDMVDRAVLLFCLGDTGGALKAIDEAASTGAGRSRTLLWRAFFQGQLALDAGVERSPEPVMVFQFWDKNPPDDVRSAMGEWRELVGPAAYRSFDETSARDVLASAGIPGLLDAYDKAWHPAMKSDIFRLVQMLLHGGLYVDADMRPAPAALATLANASRDLHLMFCAHMPDGRMQNSVMLVSAGHSILHLAIGMCIQNVLDGSKRAPNGATGPIVITRCLLALLEKGHLQGSMMAYSACSHRLARNYPASYKGSERSWQVALRGL